MGFVLAGLTAVLCAVIVRERHTRPYDPAHYEPDPETGISEAEWWDAIR